MSMDKLYESKKRINKINSNQEVRTTAPNVARLPFNDQYKRVTTYVLPSIYKRILLLKSTGKIRTLTDFVNDAFSDALKKYE